MIREHLTAENWGDVVTLGTLALTLWVMVGVAVRRTWKWTALGRALTVFLMCLAVSYSVAALMTVFDLPIWGPPIRWSFRFAIEASSLVAIAVLAFDEPPPAPDFAAEIRELREELEALRIAQEGSA